MYIYTSLYILLAILFDNPGIICVFWTGSVGMSSTCGAGSMHPGWPLLGSSSEMLVTFTGLDYCTFFPMLFPFSNTDIITYIYIYIPCIYTMFDRSCKSWIYINYCLTVRKKIKNNWHGVIESHIESYQWMVLSLDGFEILRRGPSLAPGAHRSAQLQGGFVFSLCWSAWGNEEKTHKA